jgi:hypothetical protein
MLLSAIIALSLTSYMQLSRTALMNSNRSYHQNAAMNLAEQGIEEALYALNQDVASGTYLWTGWTISGANAQREWSGVQLLQGSTATYRVYIYNYAAANPAAKTIFSRCRVTVGGGVSAPIEKWVRVTCRKASKFANGLVARSGIVFNGNYVSIDSWNSDPDNNPATPPVAYNASDPAVRHDLGSVGSVSVTVGSVAVNNADIWGYVSTGGAAPSVGSGGRIGPFGTAGNTIDPSRVNTDFTANFQAVSAPSGSYSMYGGAITGNESLPRTSDTTMGTGAFAGYHMIQADSINLNSRVLTITGKVVLQLTNVFTAIDITGGAGELALAANAALQIYTPGDIKIAGKGLTNAGTTEAAAGQPINCQIYGTKTYGTQSIDIAGNGVLSAAVYAPNGSLKINGNGSVLGSFVANDITVVGQAAFHYDESMANYGGTNPFRISSWRELTSAADRAASEAAVLNW